MKSEEIKPIPLTRSKPLLIFARIASFVFHPFFMTTVAAIIIYKLVPVIFYNYHSSEIRPWIGKLALFTILLPFLSVLVFRISGLISNARMHKPADRIFPLFTALVFYSLAYLLIGRKLPVLFIHSLLLGTCCAIFIIFIVNNFYKMSVHTTAAAILPGICLVVMLSGKMTILPLLITSIIAIIVGLARRLLGAHTIGQILLGYLVGISTQLGAYYYLHS
jgi:membrane-associated phospholipid phosphatase